MTSATAHASRPIDRSIIIDDFQRKRSFTETICEPLGAEDCVIQSMPDVSPTMWHLAHTTWFFETFLLIPHLDQYQPYHPAFSYLFNSYYNALGEQFPRPRRGVLSRPTVDEIMLYRRAVDQSMVRLLDSATEDKLADLHRLTELGLQHEQQHQELILTDIKHVLSENPLYPQYHQAAIASQAQSAPLGWRQFDEGLYEIGHNGSEFCYDNELPRHRVFLEEFSIASRLVTNGEYLEFMRDKGYQNSELWLSEGWATVQQKEWRSPLYWVQRDGQWFEYTLSGLMELDPRLPVVHVCYFEADAYAKWVGARLAREAEWEIAARDATLEGNFVESGKLHPQSAPSDSGGLHQVWGDLWEWTASPYVAYPGYQPPPGALGEYNGKFMCNQFVLRGGSCVTSASHMRPTYRNFFPPSARWQFTGIRLAG